MRGTGRARGAVVLSLGILVGGLLLGLTACRTSATGRGVSASHYVLAPPMKALPKLMYHADAGPAAVEVEVTSSSVEPTTLKTVDGSASGSWGPAAPTKPGHHWMIIRAYATNRSWDYPPTDLGGSEPVLTVRQKPVLPDGEDNGGVAASYLLSPPPADLMSRRLMKNFPNARKVFDATYEVPSSSPASYTLSWDLGKAGIARVNFSF